MANSPKVRSDTALLKKLTQQLVAPYMTRVGIIGKKAYANREESEQTNADIGIKHEFGVRSENIPKRSFLIEPIRERFEKEVVKHQKALTAKMEALDIEGVYELLGIIGEKVVQEAFETGGFGKWKPNALRTIQAKGSDKPLIDTSQLRKSITSDVREK